MALQLAALVTSQRPEKGALPMADDGSVTRWLGQLQAGDPAAAQQLWERYFRRLVGLARLKLGDAPRRAADEEDVALSAFDSFCRNAEQGRFPQLSDRDSLWRLLVVLTARKAQHLVRDETRQKRGGGDRALSDTSGGPDEDSVLEQVLSREPTPDMAAQLAEEYRELLHRLGDPELEAIALQRMEGYSVEEIAQKFGYVARSIKRKLRLIRTIWEKEVR
jgi:DNA-directed RNA polymerase specialized sigma24 family protein